MEGFQGSCGGNRRRFLKTAAAAGPVLTAASPCSRPTRALPSITLGKTGQKVSRLGMGSSWTIEPSFVQPLHLASGVTYIDTAEGYENGGKSERTIGARCYSGPASARMCSWSPRLTPPARSAAISEGFALLRDGRPGRSPRAAAQTDYIDSYFMHGLTGAPRFPLLG